MTDTTTKEGRTKRLYELVKHYSESKNWAALTNLIGGSPKADLTDYVYGQDEGGDPAGYRDNN